MYNYITIRQFDGNMYNPNIPNINEVGHYKKINVTELRQMPEDELIRFFVDMPGGEFGRQKKEMTDVESREVTEFINSIPKNTFDKIKKQKQQKIENKRVNLVQQCNNTLYEINNAINLGRQALEEATALMHDMNTFIDEYK